MATFRSAAASAAEPSPVGAIAGLVTSFALLDVPWRVVYASPMSTRGMTGRDPATDAVLIGETLLGQFHELIPRLTSLSPADVSVAMGEAQSLYPELWATLDRARGLLRERGVDIPRYDEARARQPAAMLGVQVHTRERSELADAATMTMFLFGGVSGLVAGTAIDVVGSLGAKKGEANRSGLKDARTAIDALRAAMPEVDWKAVRQHEAREAAVALDDMGRARTRKLVLGLAGVAVAVLIGFGLVKILRSSRAPTPEEVSVKKNADYREAQAEIRDLNAVLKQTPCDTQAAERRVSLFQTHEQMVTARKLARKFLEQCGDNAKLRAIADQAPAAPR